jgi:hypothetical protein
MTAAGLALLRTPQGAQSPLLRPCTHTLHLAGDSASHHSLQHRLQLPAPTATPGPSQGCVTTRTHAAGGVSLPPLGRHSHHSCFIPGDTGPPAPPAPPHHTGSCAMINEPPDSMQVLPVDPSMAVGGAAACVGAVREQSQPGWFSTPAPAPPTAHAQRRCSSRWLLACMATSLTGWRHSPFKRVNTRSGAQQMAAPGAESRRPSC